MRKQNNPSQVFLHILQEAEISAIPKTQNMEIVNLLSHVRLVCDIHCAHVCRCYSTIFCFLLKPKRLIFLINCRSNLKMSIVNRAKKMKKKWLTMPTLTKENVIFDSKLSAGWFSVAEGAEVDAYDWNQGNWIGNILKSGRETLTDFCGTSHDKSLFQLVVTLCW